MLVASPRLAAIAGMPRRAAVSAAATVPDMAISSARLGPAFRPDTTRSGGGAQSVRIATNAASDGVPATAVAGCPLAVGRATTSSGPVVIVLLAPVWLVAGATTMSAIAGAAASVR